MNKPTQQVSINPSRYKRQGSFHQFDLGRQAALSLIVLLRETSLSEYPVLLQIGDVHLKIECNSNFGNGILQDDGRTIILRSNRTDLIEIANDLQNILETEETDDTGPLHLHLEPGYLLPTGDVSDIVLQLDKTMHSHSCG